MKEALAKRSDFVYEGHFTNEATWDIPRQFKAAGFTIHLIYFGLADTTLSELNVVDRAREGGHSVDPVMIANNFYDNLQKLNEHYEMFDTLQIADTDNKNVLGNVRQKIFYHCTDSAGGQCCRNHI